MQKVKMMSVIGIVIAMLFSIGLVAVPTNVEAGAKATAIEGMSYNVNASMTDNLKALVGKKVYVTLVSGDTMNGYVKAVGNNMLHLEKLGGKDFFDALIRIEKIAAIDAMFREYKR